MVEYLDRIFRDFFWRRVGDIASITNRRMSHELFDYLPNKVMRLPLYGIVEDIEVR